ncbi:MAG: hypothetical protein N3H84_05575, partial [Candidatus Caldarchaeum sp.]|nr:hypothetical protein [Candidatus Caldarchaeum sp.]
MSSSEAVAKKFSQGPEWLRSLRVKCFEMYSSLPPEVSELYVRHYEAPSIDDQKLLENIDADDSRSIPQDFAHLTEDSAHPTAIFVGKHLAHIHLTEEVEKTGTLFLSWSEAVKRQESFLRDAYTRILNSPYVDKYAYLI